MRGLYGKVAGEELELLRYANTWLAVRTRTGRLEYVAPDTVELTGADLELFADRRRGTFHTTGKLPGARGQRRARSSWSGPGAESAIGRYPGPAPSG